MKKIDYILIYLVFLFGIVPSLNTFIPQWSEFLDSALYLKNGIGAVDIVLLLMIGITVYRYINKKYINKQKLGIGHVIAVFAIWLLFEILRNLGIYGLSAPGEFRFRYLILALPLFIALNFTSYEARKKLAIFFIKIGYYLPLLYIPIIGTMKGWGFGSENRFLDSQSHLGMIYTLTLIWLSSKYKYLKVSKNVLLISIIPFTFFFLVDSHRSAWLAGAFVLLTMIYLKELKLNNFFKIIPYVLIIGAILLPSKNFSKIDYLKYIQERGLAFVDPEADPTSNWRLMMWTAQMEKFFKSPLLGEGFGGYWTVVFPDGRIGNVSPHNYYVQSLIKIGIIGLALYFIIVFKLFNRLKEFLKYAKRKYNPELPIIILGFCVLITMHVYYLVYSLEYYSLIYLGLAIAVITDKKYYVNEQ